MAGLVVGSGGPAELHGVAPGASLLPIRVAGWQPDTSGGVSVYGRTDQLLAGLELAVDPNEDGDAHDAARVALVGVVEPFAAFADGPLAAAAAGAPLARLARGRSRPATTGRPGPAYGSIGGPGGAPAALTAGAIDTRRRSPTGARPPARGPLACSSPATSRSAASSPRRSSVAAPVVALARARRAVVGAAGRPHPPLRQRRLQPRRRCGRAPPAGHLVARGRARGRRRRSARRARRRAAPGRIARHRRARRGPDPRALGRATPTRSAPRSDAAIPVTLAVGAAAFDANAERGDAAPFSSEGLAFDGGPKPEVSAAGIGLATADPGRNEDGAARYGTLSGSSAAAALDRRRRRAARARRGPTSTPPASSRRSSPPSPRRGGATAAGSVDPAGAAAVELVADPPAVGLGVALAENADVGRTVTLRNVSRRALELTIEPGAADAADIEVDVAAARLRAAGPGASVEIAVAATRPAAARTPRRRSAARLRVKVRNGTTAPDSVDDRGARSSNARPDPASPGSRAGRSRRPTSSPPCSRSSPDGSTAPPSARSSSRSRS